MHLQDNAYGYTCQVSIIILICVFWKNDALVSFYAIIRDRVYGAVECYNGFSNFSREKPRASYQIVIY